MRFITLRAMMGDGYGGHQDPALRHQEHHWAAESGPKMTATYTELRDGYGGQVFRVLETPDEIEKMIEEASK